MTGKEDQIMAKSIVIITGASSGIGMEFALQIDAHLRKTDEIWLIARNRQKLKTLASQLRNNVRVLAMDITVGAQIDRLRDLLEEEHCRIRMLVNSAGYGVIGDVAQLTIQEQLGMVQLNCEALTAVTRCCLPFMSRNSRIIQMASSAAFVAQPGFAVYAASKAYVDSFSLALREELKKQEIYVTSVCPGPVDTPFFDTAEKHGSTLSIKKLTMVSAEQVVQKALRDACHKRARSVCSLPIQAFEGICKVLPHTLIAAVIRMIYG